ncbi:RNA-directed DNA polymerase from mobile element jockey [Trichonephila clavipes]|nr:RNA-directed DNA polymerase from mobile element jockey [Trichonephila clavipes]
MQRFLDKLENWLTDWRIAINVEKTQAIVFRKWGVIDPQTELTLFGDNIQWVTVVRYLGLHIDSRLTYKNHIDYLLDKFWGRIALAISLIGRSSPLSLENKLPEFLETTLFFSIFAHFSIFALLHVACFLAFESDFAINQFQQSTIAAWQPPADFLPAVLRCSLSTLDGVQPPPSTWQMIWILLQSRSLELTAALPAPTSSTGGSEEELRKRSSLLRNHAICCHYRQNYRTDGQLRFSIFHREE